ncbi:MAG TPA: hypothetical protein DHV05_08895 [Acholeplasmataceae bacterium]|nr:hypothetical protein [Acholeplasmataceae bacterium]
MKTYEIKESMCILIEACTRTLMHHLMDPKGSSLAGYLRVSTRDEEVKIAKCVSIYFHKAWFTEPHDFDLMASQFERILDNFKANQESLINSIISVALDIENPSSWNDMEYPMMIFENLDYTKPYNVKIIIGNKKSTYEGKNDERS